MVGAAARDPVRSAGCSCAARPSASPEELRWTIDRVRRIATSGRSLGSGGGRGLGPTDSRHRSQRSDDWSFSTRFTLQSYTRSAPHPPSIVLLTPVLSHIPVCAAVKRFVIVVPRLAATGFSVLKNAVQLYSPEDMPQQYVGLGGS